MKHFFQKYLGELIILLVFSLFFIAEIVNDRFWLNDFRVYYEAAKQFISGGNVYGVTFGLKSGFYKYSPFALLFFIPFTVLNFKVAAIIYYFIVVTIILLLFNVLKRFYSTNFFNTTKKSILITLLAFIVLADNFLRELHLGNTNTLLLILVLYSLFLLLKKKDIFAGLIFACCVLFKPHFIILIPLFVLRKEYKFLISFFAGMIAGLLLPAIFVGLEGNTLLLQSWYKTIITHNSIIFNTNATYHLIYKILSNLGLYISTNILFVVVTSVVAFLFFFLWYTNSKSEKHNVHLRNNNFFIEYILLIACIPNLTITDTEHFLFSMPLIIFLLNMLFTKKLPKWSVALVIIGFIAYGGNWHDVVGKQVHTFWNDWGLVGIGNWVLIVLTIILYKKYLSRGTKVLK